MFKADPARWHIYYMHDYIYMPYQTPKFLSCSRPEIVLPISIVVIKMIFRVPKQINDQSTQAIKDGLFW